MSDLMSDDDLERLRQRILIKKQELQERPGLEFYTYFPDTGPYRRAEYQRHLEFFRLGSKFKERLFMAANRVGKSKAGAYEVSRHLTGLYPDWWEGKRFKDAGEWWACGTTSETTRDIVQALLLGKHDGSSPGMIPPHLILDSTRRPHGLTGSIESAYIKHASGKKSLLGLKTYEQGRKSFEGTAKQGIWNDEEPPEDVYTEQLYRTLTTKGIVLVTFTPLQGMSAVVKGFLEPESDEAKESKTFVQAGWDDVPHLDESEKRIILATTPPFQRAARTKGEPSLGSGAIYPIAEADIVVPTFAIPESWPSAYGMDVGWNRTAVVWGAREVGTGIIYLYDEHYMGQGEPPSHAMAIKARGEWQTGVIDPAARGRSQRDGQQLIQNYLDLGLHLEAADNAVEAGLMEVWTLLVSGRLKIMAKCARGISEFRQYHRDEKGNIVKTNDHWMDAKRYLIKSGRDKMRPRPHTKLLNPRGPARSGGGWMAG